MGGVGERGTKVYLTDLMRRAKSKLKTDWRIRVIISVVLIILAISGVIYFLIPEAKNVSLLFGAIYASWVSNVFFFLIVGVVLAVITLSKPEKDNFDARARIFFGGQSGRHIEYIITKMNKFLEPYCLKSHQVFTFLNYDANLKMFYVDIERSLEFSGYLQDYSCSFESKITYSKAPEAPESERGQYPNTLHYVKEDGVNKYQNINFKDSIERSVTIEIPANGRYLLEYKFKVWVSEGELVRSGVRRFTKKVKAIVKNEMTNHALTASCCHDANRKWNLRAGDSETIFEGVDVDPERGKLDAQGKLSDASTGYLYGFTAVRVDA